MQYINIAFAFNVNISFSSLPPQRQAFGVALIGIGVWLETQDPAITLLIGNKVFLSVAHVIIAVGCAIAVVTVIGIVGALCETKINKIKINKILLLIVSVSPVAFTLQDH